MIPESTTSLSRKAIRRNENNEWQNIEAQLGKDRVKSIRKTLSKLAAGKVIVFPAVETHLNVPPAPLKTGSI